MLSEEELDGMTVHELIEQIRSLREKLRLEEATRKQMEVYRNEWRAKANKFESEIAAAKFIEANFEQYKTDSDALLDKVKKERDDLREKLSKAEEKWPCGHLKSLRVFVHRGPFHEPSERCTPECDAGPVCTICEAERQLCEAREERDEALAACAAWTNLANSGWSLQGHTLDCTNANYIIGTCSETCKATKRMLESNPGQPLLDRLHAAEKERDERSEEALRNAVLATNAAQDIQRLGEGVKALEAFRIFAHDKLADALFIILKYDFVFRRFPRDMVKEPPKDESERWEALAFSLYTDLASIASRAESVKHDAAALQRIFGDRASFDRLCEALVAVPADKPKENPPTCPR